MRVSRLALKAEIFSRFGDLRSCLSGCMLMASVAFAGGRAFVRKLFLFLPKFVTLVNELLLPGIQMRLVCRQSGHRFGQLGFERLVSDAPLVQRGSEGIAFLN